MLSRCYSKRFHLKRSSYSDCETCDDWLVFSNFKSWMIKQDWEGNQLDKDLIFNGNKIYSPETCAFIPGIINVFIIDHCESNAGLMTGVCFHKVRRKFMSSVNNPITRKKETIGYFNSEVEAHAAWRKRKHVIACELADMLGDERVKSALSSRYI